LSECLFVELGERDWKLIEGAAEHTNILGVTQIGGQGGLGGLVLQIASEVSPSQSAAQVLFFVTEEVLGHIVGALRRTENWRRTGVRVNIL
jgi:hypothetical protein